jgi:hypothetical protein
VVTSEGRVQPPHVHQQRDVSADAAAFAPSQPMAATVAVMFGTCQPDAATSWIQPWTSGVVVSGMTSSVG